MSSFPWLRKGSKTSNGLKRVPIKSAPFTEFHIPSSPGPLSAITTLFWGGGNKSNFFLPVAPVHISEADPTPPTAGFWEAVPAGSQPWREKISPLCTAFLMSHGREHPLPPPGIVAACGDFWFFNQSCVSAGFLLAVLVFHDTTFLWVIQADFKQTAQSYHGLSA